MTRITTVVAALLVVGATGCTGINKYTNLEREAAATDARLKEATAKVGVLESRLEAAEARAKAAEEKAAAAETKAKDSAEWAAGSEAKAQALQAQLEQAKKELAAVSEARDALQVKTAALVEKSTEYENLAGSLQKQIEAGQVELSQLKDKMTVKLKDRILFASGSASLNPEGRKALDAVAGAFKNLEGKNVLVAGYTDDVRVSKGLPYKDNWDLSSARAIAVVRYLVSKGVPPEMLAAAGYSQFRPLAPNDSPANRSMNRRIEIALTAADEAPVAETK
ncbi:MAG TPA: OmpA family protein [Anaeromyxobacter sp.]|nr:OmpA family protein [Anaeromyxobacter sp.]